MAKVREKITKTDKNHGTPTTGKKKKKKTAPIKSLNHYDKHISETGDPNIIQKGRYACANTSNGNKTAFQEGLKTPAFWRRRERGGRCDTNGKQRN